MLRKPIRISHNMLYETETSRFKVKFNGPDTVEEADQQAGKKGAALEEGVYSIIYRATLPEFWRKFVPEITKLTGIAREVDVAATEKARARAVKAGKDPKDVKDVPEKWSAYDRRVWAQVDEATRGQLMSLAQTVADGISITFAPTKRGAGIDKKFLVKADSLLTLSDDELDAKINKYLGIIPGYELDRDEDGRPERESLARLVEQVFEATI